MIRTNARTLKRFSQSIFILLTTFLYATSLTVQSNGRIPSNAALHMGVGPFGFGSSSSGGSASSIPTSISDRDKQSIEAVKAAVKNPKTPGFPLIECEFPPLQALNKLGDGSLRSANQVDEANLAYCTKLARGLAPLPMFGPKVWCLTSTAVSTQFMSKAKKALGAAGCSVTSMRDGLPAGVGPDDICIVVSPSSRQDYVIARDIASNGSVAGVVLVNGFAKDQKSVSDAATMAYYQKPLTYNSQVVGYLVRKYPKDWTTIDVVSKEVLGIFTDSEILFGKTNTPDLRESGRLVQKSVDERAIRARTK